jgi:exosortase
MKALVGRRPRVELGGAVLVVALGALYAPVLRALVARWAEVPYYSYGFLVPVFSLYLAWDARHELARRPAAPSGAGLGLLAAGLAVLAAGALGGSLTIQALSLPLVAAGALVLLLGRARTRVLAFPLGFLACMAPLPDGAVPALSRPLQHLASGVGEWILWFLGVPVSRDGLYLALPSVTLHITEACNGLRFLLAMLVVGVAFAGMTQTAWRRRAVVVAGALAAALLANWLRIAGTGMLAELYGHEAATGAAHLLWGKLVYAGMLVPFAMLVVALKRSS